MAATYSAQVNQSLTITETWAEADEPGSSRRKNTYDNFNHSATLNSASTPPVTKGASSQVALIAGAKTIDLTATPHKVAGQAATVDGTGLKVQGFLVRVPAANTNALTIAPGGSNAYNLLGAAFLVTLYPGDVFQFTKRKDANMPDVAAGAKNILFGDASAGGTESFDLEILFG